MLALEAEGRKIVWEVARFPVRWAVAILADGLTRVLVDVLMTRGTVLGQRLESAFLVTVLTRHLMMFAKQREARVLVMVEDWRLPACRGVAGGTILWIELALVHVLVAARTALVLDATELPVLMATRARHRGVLSVQPER